MVLSARHALASALLVCGLLVKMSQAQAQPLDLDPWIMPFDVNQRFAGDARGPFTSQAPGVVGAQASSTNNLINATLESYTQEGWSCGRCHQNAFPLGVSLPLPPIQQEYDVLRTISFVLQNARSHRSQPARPHHHRR
jgi:hypothetical protein